MPLGASTAAWLSFRAFVPVVSSLPQKCNHVSGQGRRASIPPPPPRHMCFMGYSLWPLAIKWRFRSQGNCTYRFTIFQCFVRQARAALKVRKRKLQRCLSTARVSSIIGWLVSHFPSFRCPALFCKSCTGCFSLDILPGWTPLVKIHSFTMLVIWGPPPRRAVGKSVHCILSIQRGYWKYQIENWSDDAG